MSTPPNTTPDEVRTARWPATVAWLVCCAFLVIVVAAAWMRLQDERAATDLTAGIAAGSRPEAPPLPTAGIDGDGAPGLPGGMPHGVVLVNFWASWCGPCIDEAPILREIARDYRGRVTVVGLNAGSEDTERDARAFVREHEWTFPVVHGTTTDKRAWGVGGYPETFVVGADGRVSAHVNGPIDEERVRALLDAALEDGRGTA